jgi:hypothetical protein
LLERTVAVELIALSDPCGPNRAEPGMIRLESWCDLVLPDNLCGLGELVLAGVVMPVEQVSSAVDVRLRLLPIDCRLLELAEVIL